MSLEVTPGGIDQIDPHTNRVVCSYDYRNVEGFVEISDYQGGFCILYGGFSRLVRIHRVYASFVCVCAIMHCCNKIKVEFPSDYQHLFASEHRDDIIRSAIEHAGNFIGITLRLRKEVLSFENFMADRLGKYSSDESITSLAEFVVQKITPRHPVRALSFSFACMILINCRFH